MLDENFEYLVQHMPHKLVDASDFRDLRSIGKGGYGEVLLSEHLPSKGLTAVKRLYAENLEGQSLTYFAREALILNTFDNYFLLPFLGYTVSYPFLIVTKYIPNGALYESVIGHKENRPILTPTHKTLIMMGIAFGMRAMHRANTIHRDLKSLNILLDDQLLPVICDFGISRFLNSEENSLATVQVGTPHWMAPECYDTDNYTNKVDVYSYAMLLWEIIAQDIPFKELSQTQLVINVAHQGRRPTIPPQTPPLLVQLLNRCWDADPDRRPPFEQICDYFLKTDIFFEGTDPRIIDKFRQQVVLVEEHKMQSFSLGLPPFQRYRSHSLPKPLPNLPILNTLKEKKTYGIDVNFSVHNIEPFLQRIFNFCPPDTAVHILVRLIKEDHDYIKPIVESGCLENLPFTDFTLVCEISFLVFNALQYDTDVIPPILIKKFSSMPQSEHVLPCMMFLVSKLPTNDDHIHDLLQAFVHDNMNFYKGLPNKFIALTCHCLRNGCNFHQIALQSFCDALKVIEAPEMYEQVFAALIEFYSYGIIPDAQSLIRPIDNPLSKGSALCYLVKLTPNERPISNGLIISLHKAAYSDPQAQLILLQLAENRNTTRIILDSIKCSLKDVRWGMQLILSICVHSEIRSQITSNQDLPSFFIRVLHAGQEELSRCVFSLIRRLQLTNSFAKTIMDLGVIHEMVETMKNAHEQLTISTALTFFDTFSRIAYNDQYAEVIQFLPTVLESGPNFAVMGLTIAVVLVSLYPQLKQNFQTTGMLDVARNCHLPQGYEQYQSDFLKHFS